MASLHNEISASSGQGSSSPDLLEKYRSLKRRFHELEESSNTETRSIERNVRMREEREYLLQKMKELEETGRLNINGPVDFLSSTQTPQSSTSDLSRTASTSAYALQESNLRRATGSGDTSHPHPEQMVNNGQRYVNASRQHSELFDTRNNGQTRGSTTADGQSNSQRSPQRSYAQVDQRQSSGSEGLESHHSPVDGDVNMADGHSSGRANGVGDSSPGRRDSRLRLNGTDIAAIAAAAVAASAGISTPMSTSANHASSSTQQTAPVSDHARLDPTKQQATLSTLANALGAATESSSSQDAKLAVPPAQHQAASTTASVDAEESVVTTSTSATSTTTNTSIDPNLDPSLSSDANKTIPIPTSTGPNDASSSANKPSNIDTSVGNSSNANATTSSSSATPSSSSSTPSSSLSGNPYLSLSTNLLRAGSSASPPTAHPMFMPYFFYPPTTPSPNSPSYPIPYNPYYYLTPPMIPGPNGVYPPPPPASASSPPPQQQPATEPQKAKPKRLKAHTVTTKNISIPMVPRDKKGKPMLPLNVGIMTVISLGEVCMRDHFHTERYIFPVGYEVTRRYLSTLDPTREVVYHCTILDGGDGPKFQIIPSDRPDKPIIAGTATGAWSSIVKQANAIRNRQHSNSVSGPDFFGLGQNTIKHLIQELPNADRLRDYVWQNFVEGGPLGGRHAAVIPALPDEYDSSMPIGAYYPKRDENPNPNLPRGLAHYPQHIIAQAEAQRAQKLAQEQAAATAGPSGPSSTPPTNSAVPPLDPQILAAASAAAGPSAPPAQVQPNQRTTRSATATATTPRNPQPQQPPHPVSGPAQPSPPGIGSDGPAPSTFAEILQAYPAPHVAAPPAVHQNPAQAAS